MTIMEWLNSLPADQRERALGRIEGMSLAMRICRNRVQDEQSANRKLPPGEESGLCIHAIRHVQVEIGGGRMSFPDLSPWELEEIWRIWV